MNYAYSTTPPSSLSSNFGKSLDSFNTPGLSDTLLKGLSINGDSDGIWIENWCTWGVYKGISIFIDKIKDVKVVLESRIAIPNEPPLKLSAIKKGGNN